MAKRNATSELNHDNWNDEDVPVEAGTFQKASAEELKKRVFKTAKRRNPGLGNGSTKSAFAGFEGFKTSGTTAQPASFNFGLGSSSSSSSSNGMANESANPKTSHQPTTSFISHTPITTTSTAVKEEKSSENPHSNEYYAQLKGLNESVSAWIKSHVDKNPICILTPIFRDYEHYLAGIEESEKKRDKATAVSTSKQMQTSTAQTSATSSDKTFSFTLDPKFSKTSTTSTTTTTSTPSFFGSASSFQSSNKIEMPSSGISSGFIFGNKQEDCTDKSIKNEVNPFLPTTRENFNFGQAQSTLGGSSTSFPSAGFTFGVSSTFTFSSGAKTESKPDDDDKAAEKEDDEDENSKDEFKPIVEDDALYTKRCKLFVKKEGKFNECGVGTLHVKPVPGAEDDESKKKKVQVVVRADNAIGTVLLNVVLGGTSSLPAPTRVGRNNVMLVCPLPSESDNVPLPVLVRVKEEKDADELFSQLTEMD